MIRYIVLIALFGVSVLHICDGYASELSISSDSLLLQEDIRPSEEHTQLYQDLQEYSRLQTELENYYTMHEMLQSSSHHDEEQQEAVVLDTALSLLVSKKKDLLYKHIAQIRDRLTTYPVDDILLYTLPSVQGAVERVDLQQVRQAWLDKVNDLRKQEGLSPFTLHPLLDHTAQERAEYLGDRYGSWKRPTNMATHHRPGQKKQGYDYGTMDNWFRDRGVHSVVRGRTNHTENTGYGYYSCPEEEIDCTDEMIQAIDTTYRYYMSEKRFLPHNRMQALHYLSMLGNFDYIGVGITVRGNRYYMVIHYMTEFEHPMDDQILQNQRYVEYLPL